MNKPKLVAFLVAIIILMAIVSTAVDSSAKFNPTGPQGAAYPAPDIMYFPFTPK